MNRCGFLQRHDRVRHNKGPALVGVLDHKPSAPYEQFGKRLGLISADIADDPDSLNPVGEFAAKVPAAVNDVVWLADV